MAMTTEQTTEAYRFFSVAFGAAPGTTYMGQLDEAYTAGMTTKEIVNVYATKTQFTAVYAADLSSKEFAALLIDNVVGASATTAAKDAAKDDVTAALASGWSRGDIMYQIFTNLATRTDADWVNTAKQLANEVAVSKYYTETLLKSTTDLAVLKKVLDNVTHTTDVSTTEALAAVVAVAEPTTFTLTTGVDTSTGGAGDDTFTGVVSSLTSANTLNVTDVLDGGAGTADTLNVTLDSNFTGFTTGSVKNVETINLTNAGTVARTFDASGVTGATAYVVNATTKGVSDISDMSAIATVTLNGQTAAFTTVMDAAFIALAGTADAMTLDIKDVETTISLGSIEAITLNATGTNAVTNSGGTNTSLVVTGSGAVTIDTVSTALKTFDASSSTGNIVVDTQAAGTAALTSIKTGAGKDKVTILTADVLATATLAGGTAADTLSIVSAAGGTVQYTISGFETIALANVDGALIFSGKNASDITTVSTVAGNAGATAFVLMGTGDLIVIASGETVDAGDVDSDHTGTTTVDYTATSGQKTAKTAITSAADFIFTGSTGLTVNVNDYIINTGSLITAAKATSVALNVLSAKTSASTPVEATTFDGAITAAVADSIVIDVKGAITSTGAITVAKATQAIITNAATAGSINLQAAALKELTVTSATAFDMGSSDLSAVQVLTANVNNGAFGINGTTLSKIATLTVGGTGVTNAVTGTTDSSVTFGALGGDNAYDMNIVATGMKGGFIAGKLNQALGQNITFTGSGVTGLVTLGAIGGDYSGKNVTITTAGTKGAVDLATITAKGAITVTNSSTGAFDMGNVTAGITGDVVVNLNGTVGAVTLGTFEGKTVNLNLSDTIGGSVSAIAATVLTTATIVTSALIGTTIGITAATATTSTALTGVITGGIGHDLITITNVATTKSTVLSGDLGLGTDTVSIVSKSNLAQTIDISGLLGVNTSTLTGGSLADTIKGGIGVDLITGGLGADVMTGGAGNDTFYFNSADSGVAAYDTITDLSSTDVINYGGIAPTTVTGVTGSTTTAAISLGVATFAVVTSGNATTLVQKVGILAAQLAEGKTVLFAQGADTFMFIDNGGSSDGVVVLLTGVALTTTSAAGPDSTGLIGFGG